MKEDGVSDALLRQFLLGTASDEERQRLESLFLTDSQARERILVVEQDLIEDYLDDSLTTADRERFLSQYTRTPAQRRKLRITKSITEWAGREAKVSGFTPATVSMWGRLRARLRFNPLFVIPIAAVLMIAIVLGAVWLMRRIEQRNQYLALQQELVQLNTRPSLDQLKPQISLNLTPGTVRSAEPRNELKIGNALDVVELRLFRLQKESYAKYQAVVRRVGSDQSFTIPDLQALDNGNLVPIRLPARMLLRGNYQIELSGIAPDGSVSESEEYDLTVDV